MSITIYRLPTKEDKLSFSIFHFRFPFAANKRKLPFSVSSVFHIYIWNYSISKEWKSASFFCPTINLSFQKHNCTLCAEAFRHNFYFSRLFIFHFFVFFVHLLQCAVHYGTVRYGMVRYVTLRYGIVWYGTVWHCTVGTVINY